MLGRGNLTYPDMNIVISPKNITLTV